MNYPLEYIELYVDDKLIELAEKLLAKGSSFNLMQIERNLWSAFIKLEKEYETEIKLVNKKVNRYSCECDAFSKDKICPHIVATLFKLREKLSEKKVPEKKVKSRSKLNTNIILSEVNHQDLVKFVKEYAKKNRNFALDLKTKFASSMPGTEHADTYDQLLASAFSMYKNKDGGVNQRGLKQLASVFTELISQAEDYLALKRYTEAYPILQSVLYKAPLLIKYDKEENMSFIFLQVLGLVEKIITQDISPEFKRNIFNFLIEDIPLRSIFEFNLETEYLKILLDLGMMISETEIIYENIEEWKKTIQLSKHNLANILVLNVKLLEKEKKFKEAEKMIDENLANPSILFIAIEEAKKNGDWKKIKQISLTSLNKVENARHKGMIHDVLFEAACNLENESDKEKYAIIRFLESYDFKYIDALIEDNSTEYATKLYSNLIDSLEQQTYSKSKRNSIAEIYFRNGDSKSLFAYIKKLGSLELIQMFDQRLLPKKKRQIYPLYKHLILNYLSNHLGRVPAQKIASLIQHLKSIGAHDLAYDITGFLKDEYAERHSLMDEISFL